MLRRMSQVSRRERWSRGCDGSEERTAPTPALHYSKTPLLPHSPTPPLSLSPILTLLLALCLLAPAVPGAAQEPAAGNLVKNAGFANGMEGWSPVTGPDSRPLKPEVDRGVFRGSDMASLLLPTEPGMRGIVQQLALPRDRRGTKYLFTVWVRCRNLGPDWLIRVGVQQCKGNALVRTLQNSLVPHGLDMEWAPARISFTVPEETEHLGVYAGLWFRDDLKASPPPGGGQVWFDDFSLEPVGLPAGATAPAPAANADLDVDGIFPIGERGLFLPGEPIQLMLTGKNKRNAPVEMDAAITVKDFFDQPVDRKTLRLSLAANAPFRQPVELPAPKSQGFFCVEAALTQAGDLKAVPQTSFCVLPKPGPKDPYFVVDVNGAESELVPAMLRIGVAGRKIGALVWNLLPDKRGQMAEWWKTVLTTGYLSPYWNSDLDMIGNFYIGTERYPEWFDKIMQERRKQGLFPYPDEYFRDYGDFVEAMAQAVKGRVKLWVLSEEIDGTVGVPNLQSGSPQAEMMRYVLLCRVAYQRLKKVDPQCTVIGLAVSGDFNRMPRYPLVRQLLPDLREYTDVLGPDLYTDNWNWCLQPSRGPEEGEMRAKLLETLSLQATLGKSRNIVISERGYGIPYHLSPDHPIEKQLADMTARSLIIGKSVPQVLFYALHMMASGSGYRVRQGATSTDANPLLDLALWKTEPDRGTSKYWYRPRSAVAAYATVARMLGGSTDAQEVLPQPGVYACVFKRPENAVAAVWTTDPEPCGIRVNLPAGAECVDLMGNSRPLPAGGAALTLTTSPLFLQARVAPDALADALRKAAFSRRVAGGEAHLTDLSTLTFHLTNRGAEPLPVEVQIEKVVGAEVPQKAGKATVPAGGRARLDLPLRNANPARLGAVAARVKAGEQTLEVAGDLSATPVPPAPAGVKVDGDLSEWSKQSPLVLDGLDDLYPSRDAFTRGDWSGPRDLSARVYLGWDARCLYLAARVADDVHVQRQGADKIWMDDCLQFAFDTLNDALSPQLGGKSGYDDNDYNLAMALTAQGPVCACFVERGSANTQGARAFPLAIKRVEGETLYEVAIPWENLKPLQPKAGRAFAFSCILFDVDSAAERQAGYWVGLTPGIANGQDPSAYRTFVLGK